MSKKSAAIIASVVLLTGGIAWALMFFRMYEWAPIQNPPLHPQSITTATANFLASPASGPAPLTLKFTGIAKGNYYEINFGDGSVPLTMGCSGGCALFPISATHTYTARGSFTAKLYYDVPSSSDAAPVASLDIIVTP